MNESQEKLLVLFEELINLLEKHNLKYQMFFGSLLGVIRHEGFIPWDDDIDILMPKESFDKLNELYPDRIWSYDKDNPLPFAKWVKDKKNYKDSIFIDIFVTVKSNHKLISKYYKRLSSKLSTHIRFIGDNKNLGFPKILRLLSKPFYWCVKKDQFKRAVSNYEDNENFDAEYIIEFPNKKAWKTAKLDKNFFENWEYKKFHNLKVKVNKNYIELLESQYGPSWNVPIKRMDFKKYEYVHYSTFSMKLQKKKDK